MIIYICLYLMKIKAMGVLTDSLRTYNLQKVIWMSYMEYSDL